MPLGAPPILSLSEAQAFNAMGNFLLDVCLSSDTTQPVQVLRGQASVNQVPEPACPDFIVMSPLRQRRLAYNEVNYVDNVLTGSISVIDDIPVLDVTAVAQVQGPLIPGMLLIDAIWPVMNVAGGTVIIEQLTGATGGTGTYRVSPSQTLAEETLYAGLRKDLVPTELVIQLDIHGPAAGDNAIIVEGLFRSGVGVGLFQDALLAESAPSFSVVPLYCENRGQMPFTNENKQEEYRWILDARMQIDPIISTPQQFADEVKVRLIDAVTAYPTE